MKSAQEKRARELLQLRNRITHQWKNPERYAENIVPPRLHWLFDLGLVNFTHSSQQGPELTEQGIQILSVLPKLTGSNLPDLDAVWLKDNYFSNIAPLFSSSDGTAWSALSSEAKAGLSDELLALAKKTLRKSQAPIVTMYPSLLVMAFFLAEDHQRPIWANISELQEYVASLPQCEVRFSRRDNESYIVFHGD
ncbi:MAG: hypothetical protein AB7W16_11910 [Candidatus Obscuribacterales bacterium]